MDINVCIYCGENLKGRIDKKFCNDQCRASYHNLKTNQKETFIKEVNKQLRKNRSVLRFACPEGRATTRKKFLLDNGFSFKYYTHTWTSNKANNTYFFCYDYGYLPIEDEKVLIIQMQDYM